MVRSLARQNIFPRSVIDVGANIGQFTVAASNIFDHPAITAFEPLPDCAALLRRNSERLPSVTVRQCALGASTGTVQLNVNQHRHSSSVLRLAEEHHKAFPKALEVGVTDVRLSTLDDEMIDANLVPPVLLKLDVQGYEGEVLKGAGSMLPRIDYAILETSFQALYQNEPTFLEINDVMHQLGFTFLRPVSLLEAPRTGQVLQMDALFARRA